MEAGIRFHHWDFHFPIEKLINDGLLTLFFFLIGLEVKREMLIGQLRNPRQAFLIFAAAVGGMVIPALIYAFFNHLGSGHSGWAIPMATDTAFAIGVLALLARHVSIGVSIFLAALAIFDDIGAILVIAIFYTPQVDMRFLLYATASLALLFALNVMGIRKGWVYLILGIALWWFILESGLHATLAGLLMALAVPARSRISQRSFIAKIRRQISAFEVGEKNDQDILKSNSQHVLASDISETVNAASTPLQQWYSLLEPPIAIIVLPLFALFNAGIHLSPRTLIEAMASPVTLGIVAGLVVGKPLGITLFSLAALRLHLGKMPEGMVFVELIGAGMLAGIGFTMSLFITALGFKGHAELLEPAKAGILIASVLSASLGIIWLFLTRRRRAILTGSLSRCG
jgi:Na+:H+ antiporter, NhaA family